MRCPACKSESTELLRTDYQEGTNRRRHQCKSCNFRFVTVQVYEVQFNHLRALEEWILKQDVAFLIALLPR